MVSLGALWLPILLSAVLVFVASTLIHMVLKYHASDYRALPNEDAVRAAFRGSNNPGPGQYVIPHISDMKQMGSPEHLAKCTEGPVGVRDPAAERRAHHGPEPHPVVRVHPGRLGLRGAPRVAACCRWVPNTRRCSTRSDWWLFWRTRRGNCPLLSGWESRGPLPPRKCLTA